MSGSFDFGALTLDGSPASSVPGAGSTVLGGLSMLATSSTPTVVLYDESNHWLAHLPLADGLVYGRTLSDPGFITVRLPYTDATGAAVASTGEATQGRFVKVLEDGRVQQAAEIAGETVDMAVNGRLWRVFDNLPGVLDLTRKAVVWPEYGVDRTYSSTRTFGPMSRLFAVNELVGWFRTGDWSSPTDPVRYKADTGFRQFKPASLSFPNPWWIAKNGPYHREDIGGSQWMRRQFPTYSAMKYQLLATFDDFGEVWLDGEQIIAPDPTQTQQWAELFQVKGKLQPGLHVLAARVRTDKQADDRSPLAFICTLQQLRRNGDVVDGPPIMNTHPRWNTSDVAAIGFRVNHVVRRVLFENQDDYSITGGVELIDVAFGIDSDSEGDPWDDDPDTHDADVGATLLDLITGFDSADWGMDPDRFRLLGWNRKGTDKSATVIIRRGQADIGSLLAGGIDRAGPPPTVLLIQLADTTWKQYEDTAGIAAHGRIVQAVSAGQVRTDAQAQRLANRVFRENKLAAATYTATLSGLDGPRLFTDFVEGDTIAFEDDTGSDVPVRVMGWTRDASRPGAPTTELELTLEHT